MKAGKYLSWDDVQKSQTAIRKGINNVPNESQKIAIVLLIENVYDKVKDQFPEAFTSSFFRCEKLNTSIGGAKDSQHTKGEAVDIDSYKFNKAIFEFIKNTLDFDQLIWEFGDSQQPDWVHVSLKKTGNRRQILRAQKSKGKTVYVPWN